jgi:hypothetical protein
MKTDNDWDEEKILKVRNILFDKWKKINFQLRGTPSSSPTSIQSVHPIMVKNNNGITYINPANSIIAPIQSVQPIKPSTSTLNEIEWKNWLLENNIKCYKELWTCVQFLDNDYLIVDINPLVTDAGPSPSRRDKLFLLVPKDFAKKLIVLSTFED